jgi:uncharacterized membrane protein
LLCHIDYKNIELYLAMDIKEEEEIKKEFQLERVVLFTDAVFAIILTIMVLELKLPEGIRHQPREQMIEAFGELILKFFAYGISFFLVARFWITHLTLFRYLKDYDLKLLILNLGFLFSVTLFPFAVSLISGSISPVKPEYAWGFTIYVIVFYCTVFTQTLMARYLIINKEKLCIQANQIETHLKWKLQQINLVLIPVLALLALTFNYFGLSYNFPLATIALYGITIGNLSRKLYPNANNNAPMIARLFKSIRKKPVKS